VERGCDQHTNGSSSTFAARSPDDDVTTSTAETHTSRLLGAINVFAAASVADLGVYAALWMQKASGEPGEMAVERGHMTRFNSRTKAKVRHDAAFLPAA